MSVLSRRIHLHPAAPDRSALAAIVSAAVAGTLTAIGIAAPTATATVATIAYRPRRRRRLHTRRRPRPVSPASHPSDATIDLARAFADPDEPDDTTWFDPADELLAIQAQRHAETERLRRIQERERRRG